MPLILSAIFALLVSATICLGQFALQAVILDRLPNPAAGGGCSQATTFLARTSLTGSDVTNYTNLICGLVTDGVITGDLTAGGTACGSFFDALYIFATKDAATSELNICSANFTITLFMSPTFTAYTGWTSTAGTYLSSNFNPSTATSPKYTINSAHLSVWNLTNAGATAASIIADTDPGNSENMFPKFSSDGNLYARINDSSASGGFSITDPRGHILGNRSSSTARQAYQNASTTLNGGTVVSYGSVSSIAVENDPIGIGGNGTASSGNQLAMASIGGDISSKITPFYNRLRTYMTAVGVP